MSTANNTAIQYIYDSLPVDSIRIFILEPSFDQDSPLHFHFHVESIEKLRGKYEALSYTWGEPNLNLPMYHANGSQVLIAKNLDLALRRLRHRLDPRWIWADAVCIHQTNLDEKAVQIKMMDKVYRSAKRVLAWLGVGGGNDEAGMLLLERLSQMQKPLDASDLIQIGARECSFIETFFDLPWFRRFWIVQESVLNTDVTLLCGETEITFARLRAGLKIYDRHLRMSDIPRVAPGLCAAKKTADLWKRYSFSESIRSDDTLANHLTKIHMLGISEDEVPKFERFDILTLVHQFTEHAYTDDRDRIFSLYALASNIGPKPSRACSNQQKNMVYMDVDYTLDVFDTYKAFALACLRNNMTMRIFEAALSRSPNNATSEWPSWVPDWRLNVEFRASFILPTTTFHILRLYAVSGNMLKWRPSPSYIMAGGMETSLAKVNGSGSHVPSIVKTGALDPGRSINQLLKSTQEIWEPRKAAGRGKFNTDKGFSLLFLCAVAHLHSLYGVDRLKRGMLEDGLRTLYQGGPVGNGFEDEEFMDRDSMKDLFPFRASRSVPCGREPKKWQFLGFGSGHVQKGDRLIVTDEVTRELARVYHVIIIRKVGSVSGHRKHPSYRLVGNGFLCGLPFVVCDTDLMFWMV